MKKSNDDPEFVELVLRCLDGDADLDDRKSLEHQLRSDEKTVRRYNDLCLQVHLLEDNEALGSSEARDAAGNFVAETAEQRRAPRRKRRLQGSITLAALLLGAVLGATLSWNRVREMDERLAVGSAQSTISDAFLATLADISNDVEWSPDHDMPRDRGAGLNKGWIRLDTGEVEIVFRSGASVRLKGPAMFGVDSCLRATLEYGDIKVYAPESATSFTVNTSAMEVVDFGTRFSMRVDSDSGHADVAVSEGQVDLHIGNAGLNTAIHSLKEGQSASVGTSGEILEMRGLFDDHTGESVGLLARWSFDDVDDSIESGHHIEDASTHGRHGRPLSFLDDSNSAVRSTAGVDGRALDLSNHGAVDLSEHIHQFGSLNDFTIAAWVRNPGNMIFSLSSGMDRHRIQFERHLDCLVYGWQNNGQWDSVRAVVDGGWLQDEWYHVAVAVRNGSVTLYRNGRILLGPRSTGVLLGTPVQRPIDLEQKDRALIGKADRSQSDSLRHPGWIPEQFLDGEIDDVQIYDVALDSSAIADLHANPGETFVVESGLEAGGGE